MPLLVFLSTRFVRQSQIQNEKVAPFSPGIEPVKCSTSTHPFIHIDEIAGNMAKEWSFVWNLRRVLYYCSKMFPILLSARLVKSFLGQNHIDNLKTCGHLVKF